VFSHPRVAGRRARVTTRAAEDPIQVLRLTRRYGCRSLLAPRASDQGVDAARSRSDRPQVLRPRGRDRARAYRQGTLERNELVSFRRGRERGDPGPRGRERYGPLEPSRISALPPERGRSSACSAERAARRRRFECCDDPRTDTGALRGGGVPHTRPTKIRTLIGVLPESAGYPERQTGDEYLRYYARLYGRSRPGRERSPQSSSTRSALADRGPR